MRGASVFSPSFGEPAAPPPELVAGAAGVERVVGAGDGPDSSRSGLVRVGEAGALGVAVRVGLALLGGGVGTGLVLVDGRGGVLVGEGGVLVAGGGGLLVGEGAVVGAGGVAGGEAAGRTGATAGRGGDDPPSANAQPSNPPGMVSCACAPELL